MNFYFVFAATAFSVYVFIRIFEILSIYLFRKPRDLRKLAGAPWAVVTGSTDGIGKGYAFELAARGFNVFLVSRSQKKLDVVRDEILLKHSTVEVRTVEFNFKTSAPEAYKELLKELNQVDIGILINNVGVFHDVPDKIHNVGLDLLAEMVVVDTLPPTLLTAGILPQMLKRNHGVIVNIGSTAGSIHMPLLAAYSASKKYVEWLTRTISKEYKDTNLVFQNITPLLVATKMAKIRDTSFFVPDPQSFARSAVNTIGLVAQTTGYITHQLQFEGIQHLPEFMLDYIVTKRNEESRERILKGRRGQKEE